MASRWREDSPRWMDDRQSSPKRICVRGSPPPRWNDDRGLAPRRGDGRLSPLRRHDKRTEQINERRHFRRRSEEREKVKAKSLGNRNDNRRPSPRRIDEEWLSLRRVVERQLLPSAVKSDLSTETLSHLEASGLNFFLPFTPIRCSQIYNVKNLNYHPVNAEAHQHCDCSIPVGVRSSQSDLDTMVKNLASTLVAEIKKVTPTSLSSSSSSSSSKGGKRFSSLLSTTSSSSVGKMSTLNPLRSKSFLQKSGECPSKRIEVYVRFVCLVCYEPPVFSLLTFLYLNSGAKVWAANYCETGRDYKFPLTQ